MAEVGRGACEVPGSKERDGGRVEEEFSRPEWRVVSDELGFLAGARSQEGVPTNFGIAVVRVPL